MPDPPNPYLIYAQYRLLGQIGVSYSILTQNWINFQAHMQIAVNKWLHGLWNPEVQCRILKGSSIIQIPGTSTYIKCGLGLEWGPPSLVTTG